MIGRAYTREAALPSCPASRRGLPAFCSGFLDHHRQQEGKERHLASQGHGPQFFRQLGDVVGFHGSSFLFPRTSPPKQRGFTAGGAGADEYGLAGFSRSGCGGLSAARRTLAQTAPRASAGVRHHFSSRLRPGWRAVRAIGLGMISRPESGSLTAGRIERAASARPRHYFELPDNRSEIRVQPAPGLAHRSLHVSDASPSCANTRRCVCGSYRSSLFRQPLWRRSRTECALSRNDFTIFRSATRKP